MADIVVATVRNATSTVLTASAGAATFTVPCSGVGSDHRMVLMVDNTDTEVIVRANIAAGDGERSVLAAGIKSICDLHN